ncbi:MAG: hypothetical protein K2Y33_11145, partial [Mycolicibacterium frederiksbergense]|nr:hypothetical protein [Mycolicibacterium frederiksbergense]
MTTVQLTDPAVHNDSAPDRPPGERLPRWQFRLPLRRAIIAEITGRELTPGPFLPTVAAALVIDRCAPDSVRAQLLPGLADGSTVAALGLNGLVNMESDLTATAQWPAVPGAPDADVLVLAAGADLLVVDAAADGVTDTALPSQDTTRSIAT